MLYKDVGGAQGEQDHVADVQKKLKGRLGKEGGLSIMVSELKEFQSWCQKELSRILCSNVSDDLLSYFLSIETEKDLREYLQDLLGDHKETDQSQLFLNEFFRHWRPPSDATPPLSDATESEVVLQKLSSATESEVAVQKLSRLSRDQMVLFNVQEVGGTLLPTLIYYTLP